MDDVALSADRFCSWCCEREGQVVGCPGVWFNDPLSHWMSEQLGHVYGVHENVYGPASCDVHVWRWLSRWARLFVRLAERYGHRAITGAEAFSILVEIEQRYGRNVFH